MNIILVTMSCCLLIQQAGGRDPFKPQVVPSKAPPAAIEEDASAPTSESTAEPNAVPANNGPADNGPAESAFPETPHRAKPEHATHEPDTVAPNVAAPETNLAPLDKVPRQRLRPPELLADALATPREGALEGEPLPLVQAFARTADRQQQLQIAKAYWKLSVAQAAYHWALADRDLLNGLTQAHAHLPEAASTVAAAVADLSDAQLAVAEAQQELGDLVGATGERLPLAVDRPHAGNYNTLYDDVFARRAAPPRLRLIHRTLPVRRKSIDAHAAAIVAAHDAVEAATDEFRTQGQGLAAVLSLVDQLKHEREAFLGAVRDYNDEIAEYLLAVASPGTSGQMLVSRMILTSNGAPRQGSAPKPARESAPARSGEAGVPHAAGGLDHQTSNYQPADADALVADGGLYRGLLDLASPARVQRLSGLLHWDRALPADAGKPTSLADCLRAASPDQRPALLAAYWQTRECAARYQVLNDQSEQLGALASAVGAMVGQPAMAEAGVRVQAARRAAKAAVIDAQLALLLSQFDLTQAAGCPLDQDWLLPATPPQAGRYLVADQVSGAARRWADAINLRHEGLTERADAVIRADELRASLGGPSSASAATPAAAESLPFDRALRAVAWQTAQTLAFLDGLTAYNLAITNYALTTSPPQISGDELIKRLVIARTARGES